jgi:folate-dependent phosphoribosylglycinamide formyltransferase PurN
MIIDRNQIVGFEKKIIELYGKLSDIKSDTYSKQIVTITDILTSRQICWDDIKRIFKQDFKKFEELLYRLHFKRRIKLSQQQRDSILAFLAIGYLYSSDVRYFNEFLYFYKNTNNNRDYWLLMLKLFFENLTQKNCHPFPLCEVQEIEAFIKETSNKVNLARKNDMDLEQRVGLLGSPTFFKKVRSHIISRGFFVKCYFIPFHSNKMINFILKNKITFLFLCLVKGIDFKFLRLDYKYNDPSITEQLRKDKLDIGFHKLGFIIKNNIIKSFHIGIINDHWAALPYIRGRSSIEYSLLYGIPVAATTHIVEEDVDSGGIINIYRYDRSKKHTKIRHIRNLIRQEREHRAIDSIELLAKVKKPINSNRNNRGLMHYSIHPSLKDFIESYVLK